MKPPGITQSLLGQWRDCRYKASLALQTWVPKRRKQSFRFGSLVHDGLETIYKSIRAGKPLTEDEIRARIQKVTNDNLRDALPSESRDDVEMEGVHAEALLAGPYLSYWKEDRSRDWVDIEGEFDTTLWGHRVRGKRDAVFRDRKKQLWLLETKTKSQISEDDLELQLPFDFQSLFYIMTLEKLMPGEKVAGCLYNILRKPQLREKTKAKETRSEFIARTISDVKKRPDHYFKRFELTFPEKVRARFTDDLRAQLDEFASWWKGEIPTYKNPNSCVTRYRCEYLEHCSSGTFTGYIKTGRVSPELSNLSDKEGATRGDQKTDPEKAGKGRQPCKTPPQRPAGFAV